MKVKVDEEKCIACGACVAIAGENFDFNAEGLSTVINDEVTDNTRMAVDACPVYAISIDENNENMKAEKHECECGGACKCDNVCEFHKDSHEDKEELEEAA